MSNVTQILSAIEDGDTNAADELLSQVIDEVQGSIREVDVLDIDEALQKLEAHDPRKAELVRLRFFAGLTLSEAARALGVSGSTVDNDWAYAKAWLRVEMFESA